MIHSLHQLVRLSLSLPASIISSHLQTFLPIFTNPLLSIRLQNTVLLINAHTSYPVNLYILHHYHS